MSKKKRSQYLFFEILDYRKIVFFHAAIMKISYRCIFS
ncbi:hypothetical protein AC520_3055 [Enterobacter sp. OLF]|nr:hypothetical protein AC520_4209 [Enterobacter sp. OLF]PUB50611.1 hypothetical protein AC520_3055 [Enterobacter sp. OLF]